MSLEGDGAENFSESEKNMKSSNTIEVLTDIENCVEESLPEGKFNPDDKRDLQILLDQPKKHVTSFETYISYCITTKTSRAEYEKQEYVVHRRYSDFEWLRLQLTHIYPTHIVPPLPEKHTLFEQIDRYDRSFIVSRMQLLGRFLNRLADHSIFSRDKHYKAFITELPSEFSQFKKSSNSVGLLSRMSESFHNLTTSYFAKGRTTEFEKMNDYISKLTEKINTMEKIGNRVQKERLAYLQDLQKMQPALNTWAKGEPELANTLEAIGFAATTCSNAEINLIEKHRHNVSVPLHEYKLYTESAKDALNHRDSAQIDYEVHMEQLSRVKDEQTQLESSPNHSVRFTMHPWRSQEQQQRHRKQQLSTAANTLTQEVELSRNKLESADENLRAEFERWNQVKTGDLKFILTEMANLHIQLYEETIAAWSKALPLVKNQM